MLLIILFLIILSLLFIYYKNSFIIERMGNVKRPNWGSVGYTSNWGNWGELPQGSYSDFQDSCNCGLVNQNSKRKT